MVLLFDFDTFETVFLVAFVGDSWSICIVIYKYKKYLLKVVGIYVFASWNTEMTSLNTY